MRLFASDAETYSALELKKHGAYLYARHPSTNVRCVSYCLIVDGQRGPVKVWYPGDLPPSELLDIEHDPDAFTVAYHDAFDRQIHLVILTQRYGWPFIPLERRYCAQAAVLARALPAGLDQAAAALKICTRKSKEGIAVMKRLAKPRRQSAKERKAGVPLDFSATSEELKILDDYVRTDTTIMLDVIDRVGLLTPAEQAIWLLDQQINERGVHMDVALLESALLLEQAAKRDVRARITELTGGIVTTAGQRDKILAWLTDRGCKIGNLRKGTVADALLEPGLAEPARQLLRLRQDGAGTAALKFSTLRRWTCDDGEPRIRHAYRYHGSSAGRFTSMGVQLHNLRKPELPNIADAIAAVATGSLDEIRRRGFERPLETLGQIARATVSAPPGKRLLIADLSGIESRGAAHIVGATRKLELWRTFDRTRKPEDEPYYVTGLGTFHQPKESARKAGKTGELAFQYQGGIGAYRRITSDNTTIDDVIATRRDAWRRDHPEYVRFWNLAIFQAVQAIRHPGMEFTANAITFQYDHCTGFLEVTLPSGRKLTYPHAELIEDEQYGTTSLTFLDASGSATGRMYHERHQGNGAFGGLMLENITQAFCRDIFVAAMPKLEAAGYAIVMHTHDEWCCEVPNDRGSLDEFLAIVTTPPPWAADLPIAAKARISDRLIEIPEPVQAVAVVADNAIDNAMADLQEGETEDEDDAERDDNEADSVEPDIVEQTEVIPDAAAPVALPAPQLHICAYCQHEPDGSEQPSAYEGAWLHPGCFDAFVKHKMAEQGAAWSAAPEPPKTGADEGNGAAPSAASGANGHAANGNGGTDNDRLNTFDIAEFLQPRTAIQLQGARDDYPHGESAAPSAGPTTAEYIYKDARDRLYMRVVRTAGHTFPTYHFSDGAWVSGWPQRVVPYRLPELLASSPDTVVLVCEGEKDADTAARYGFVATTNPGGAAKWQPELAQYFQGKQRVCIVEDNDAMGAKNTATIVKALGNVVPMIGVVRFPELGRGGDLSDYFERGGSKPYLVTRIEEALRQGSARNYTLINLHECPLEAQIWLWKGHLPIGALELLTGAPGVGKSLLQCDFITTITTGRNWPDGASGPQPGQVIALTAEDRASDYRRRLTAAGADLTKVKLLSYVRRNAREELFLLSEDLDKLEQAVNDLGDVRLVAIDPITAFMGHGRGFDSHRASDVRSQLHPLSRLAEKLSVAFSAVTHPPKNASARAAMDSFIGSQAFIAAARVGHYCASELGSEDERGHRRPTGRVLFATPKASHSAAMPTLAYRIEEVRIGWDAERGQDITAPRVVWEGEPVDITADEAIASNKMTLGDGRKPRAAAVREFLRGLLAGGPVLYKAVVERGAARGFSVDQLKHARRAIGAVAFKRRGENLSSPWLWSLLEHMPADAEPEV